MNTITDTTPRVWIACLSCYNSGHLVGDWFPAEIADDVTLDEIHAHFGGTRMDCEEVWCFDTDNLPVSREMSVTEASAWGRLIAEVDEWQRAAFLAWVAAGSYSMDGDGLPSVSEFEDAYAGEWGSFREFAEDFADSAGLLDGVPELVATYFDWSAWARDLAYDFHAEPAPGGGVYVFRSL